MSNRVINLLQSIEPSNNRRSNAYPITDEVLDASFVDNTGTCQSGGITPLYEKIQAIGITWTQRTLPANTGWCSVTSRNSDGLFVAVAVNTNIAATSPDGITWTQRTLPANAYWRSVTSRDSDGLFVAVASDTNIAATSPDGINWTQRTLPANNGWYSVTSRNSDGLFVAVASDTNIAATSPDGITWTQRTLSDNVAWYSVTSRDSDGLFVAVAYDTNIASTSPDGITWTQRTLPANLYWLSVTSRDSDGLFVAVAIDTNIAATSPDGITWTQIRLPANIAWYSVTSRDSDGLFVAVANGSDIAATSPDGINWTQRTLPANTGWCSVTSRNSDGLFVAVAIGSDIAATGISNPLITIDDNGSVIDITNSTNSNYRNVYLNNILLRTIFNKGLLQTTVNAIYSDIQYGATIIYGCRVLGGIIYVDVLDENLEFQYNIKQYTATNARGAMFLKHITASDDIYILYNVSDDSYVIYNDISSGSISNIIAQSGYFLSDDGTYIYVLIGNENISNIQGNAISFWTTKRITKSNGTITAITTKDCWSVSYNYSGSVGIVGIDYNGSNYAYNHFIVSTTGVFTSVNSPSYTSGVKDSINGLVGEYETYQIYSALSGYNSVNKSGSATDGVNLRGYYSIINALDYSGLGEFIYLRCIYNITTQTCAALSISTNNNFIGRIIDTENVDFTYRPQFFIYDTKIVLIYRTLEGVLNNLVFDDIINCPNTFTRVGDNKYLINTLDIFNLIDCDKSVCEATEIDYNGAIEYTATDANKYLYQINNTNFVTRYATYTTGERVIGLPLVGSDYMNSITDQGLYYSGMNGTGIDAIFDNFYVANGYKIEKNNFASSEFIANNNYTTIPIYSKISNGFVFVDGELYLQDQYRIMNIDFTQLIGTQQYKSAEFFSLFGNQYFFDGSNINLINITDQIVEFVCYAGGLILITYSQQVAYLFSYLDNSIYLFDGGRTLQKYIQLNAIYSVDNTQEITGSYSVKDSCLTLTKGGKTVLVYDNKISNFSKTDGTVVIRNSGIYYIKQGNIFQLSPFMADSDYYSLQFTWQSAFFKSSGSKYAWSECIFHFYSPTKNEGDINISVLSYDEDTTITTQIETFAVTTATYDTNGYFMVRIQPGTASFYGLSLKIDTDIDIMLLDAILDVDRQGEIVETIHSL